MKRKTFLGTLMILLLLFSTSIATGEMRDDKKLGYGFAPGLVAGKDFVPGQLIVGIQEGVGTQEIKQAVAASGVQISKEIEGALLLQFPSEEAAVAAVSGLLSRPEVIFVERNGFMHIPPQPKLINEKCGGCNRAAKGDVSPQYVGSDPGTGYQWHHTVIRKTAALPTLSTTPPTVAVIDTGVDYTHPELSGKVYLGKDCVANDMDPMDDNGHGTHCAGLIAAKSGNGDYGEGVCHNCKILAIKVLGSDGYGSFFDVAEGMQYAINVRNTTSPVTKVVSMSLGGPSSSLIAAKVLAMKTAGMVLAAAAGNENSSTTPTYPGADPNTALRVMATNEVDCRAWFSNFSPSATPSLYNIAAPGWHIYSTFPDASFGTASGTSMATPIVAGAAALVWGQIPSLTRDTLISRLLTYGQPISCGFAAASKRVDVRKAILATSETAVIGGILDPFTAKAPSSPLVPTNARLRSGTTVLASDQTNRGGAYEMTGLAAGTGRNLSGDRSGYINTYLRYPITVSTGVVRGPYMDGLPAARATGNATVLFDWKTAQPVVSTTGCLTGMGTTPCLGWEFDLWVKTPGGSYIGWNNRGDLLTSPYVRYARDSYDDLNPMETIVVGSSASNGVYKVFVEKYPYASDWHQNWYGSQASFQAYNGAASISGHYYDRNCTTYRYWYVGNLTKSGTSYTWTSVNSCTNTKP